MYIIGKKSRDPLGPYSGPTCFLAEVPQGKIYLSKFEAQQDVEKLEVYNPVGFQVYIYKKKELTLSEYIKRQNRERAKARARVKRDEVVINCELCAISNPLLPFHLGCVYRPSSINKV